MPDEIYDQREGIKSLIPRTSPAFVAYTEPDDPLTAKRKREAFINAAFTREQQQAIGMILERWWGQKMAGIETSKVIEATEHLPRAIAELSEKLEAAVKEFRSQ
jgi:hypothetical protein